MFAALVGASPAFTMLPGNHQSSGRSGRAIVVQDQSGGRSLNQQMKKPMADESWCPRYVHRRQAEAKAGFSAGPR